MSTRSPTRSCLFAGLALVLLSVTCGGGAEQAPARPNLLLIVADDLGWSDLGAFGGEIATPRLDALAFAGVRMTDFHVTPTCSPTRATLLTGVDPHLAGLGNMDEELGPNQRGAPGYEGYLNDRVVTVATLLADVGYRTMMSGKWHLGGSVERGPERRGFHDAFVLPGGGNHFNQNRAVYVGGDPGVITKAVYRENGVSVELPEDYYSSAYFTDRLLHFLSDHFARDSGEPFFAFASYHAPHWPLQAPESFIERYDGVYDVGYEAIRARRWDRIRALGLLDADVDLEGAPDWPRWEQLDPETRASEARRMQVYAGMVDALDLHVGRLIDYLDEVGELSNTVVIFLSDNGAEGNDLYQIPGNDLWIPANFDNSIENMGTASSHIAYGPRWAEVSMTPFGGFKGFVSQGGTVSPAFVTYPGFDRQRTIYPGFVSVADVVPTLLELAGASFPAADGLHPPRGASLLPYLRGEADEVHGPDVISAVELFNRRAIRRGGFKLVHQDGPFGSGRWELFDLTRDPTESIDVSGKHPDVEAELLEAWSRYERENGVILDPELALGYSSKNEHFDRERLR